MSIQAGAFAFNELDDHSHGSVLLAFHSEHYAGGIDLSGARELPEHPVIILEPATPIQVQVVDALGKPQDGATVHHAALARSPHPDQPPVQAYEGFFAQNGVTGTDGRIALSPFRGEQVLWAVKGELLSLPWQGMQPSSVVLRLGESFTIDGTVALSGLQDKDPTHEQGLRLLVSGLKGNLWRQLACLPDVREGAWGPMRLPLDEVSRYEVRLEGTHIIPIEKSFSRPRSASHRHIDFVATGGAELYLTVEDDVGEPIPTARAEAWWEPGTLPKLRVSGRAGPDGVIRLGPLPPGMVRFDVGAPGYADQEMWEIQIVDTTRTDIILQRGGGIAGRCAHEGQPVTDFEVIYWKVGNVSIYRGKAFLGRGDGRFEIDGLAPGDWSIHAASPLHPSGQPITAGVHVDQVTEVEIDLPAAIRGVGRVLAADTGEPVSDAHVQPFSSGGLKRSLPWGPGVLTAEDGGFDVVAFALGLIYLTVEAVGFATAEAEANATSGDLLDWGDIRLVRPQALRVSLIGLDMLQNGGPEDFRCTTLEGHLLPEKRFDSDGQVIYPEVPPGDIRLMVYDPDGSWARLHLRLDPGEDWTFDLKVAGDRKLEIHVADAGGKPLPYVPSVMVGAHEETGVLVVRVKETSKGLASFEGIRSSRVQVIVLDTNYNFVASRDVAFGSDAIKSIDMRVGEEPLRVHVVDSNHDPVPGAHVTVRSANGAEVHGIGQTGAEGWAELVGLPSGPLLMDVQHGVVGRSFGNPIDASVRELEFVLEASGSLELGLFDGDAPLAGVITRIQTTAGVTLGDARQTDDEGRVRYESLGQGSYHLACHRTDCWPVTVDEELAPDEQARVRVQMRQLADLAFTLLSSEGLPVSGAEVDFHSDEFDIPIDAWLAEEKIRAPSGLTTDNRGVIRIEGLPRGTYTWSAIVVDQALEGTLDLKPAQENRVSAFLPR